MRLPCRCAIERLPLLEADGNLPVAAQVDDFLNAGAACALRDQHAIDDPAGLQGFTNRMDPDENTHDFDVTVTGFSDFSRVNRMEIEKALTMSTTRRTAITTLLGLGSGTAVYGSSLNRNAWRAYEAVEEAWIRERHALLIEQCPECAEAARHRPRPEARRTAPAGDAVSISRQTSPGSASRRHVAAFLAADDRRRSEKPACDQSSLPAQ